MVASTRRDALCVNRALRSSDNPLLFLPFARTDFPKRGLRHLAPVTTFCTLVTCHYSISITARSILPRVQAKSQLLSPEALTIETKLIDPSFSWSTSRRFHFRRRDKQVTDCMICHRRTSWPASVFSRGNCREVHKRVCYFRALS